MSGSLLDRILAPGGLRPHLQPIVCAAAPGADGGEAVVGVEALMRGTAGTNVETADVLFEYARRKRALEQVDHACIRAALAVAPPAGRLFLNVHAVTLLAGASFGRFLRASAQNAGVQPERLVVEVVEQVAVRDMGAVDRALCSAREAGAQVALDDFGTGHSNFDRLVGLSPEFVKVAGPLVRAAARNPVAARVLRGIVRIATDLDITCIAEGVETRCELAAARHAGAALAQGYLFGAPAPALAA